MTIALEDVLQRVTDLEIRAAYYEQMADDLSQIIARQSDTIDRLALQLRHLSDRQKGMEAQWSPSPQDSKPPPHY